MIESGVYIRCPIITEEADNAYPRSFIFAQVIKHNELSDTVTVSIHDLAGSEQYYSHAFAKKEFPVNEVMHCKAIRGSQFCSEHGNGYILACASATSTDKPYEYYVQLENGEYRRICETEMRIDYSRMNFSPLEQMLRYEFQNPSWYANRIKAHRNAYMIDNASYGFKTLAGCRTFLLPHQISTISRCFEFAPIRYMLADEVGLGKTIEASGIIKIMLAENADSRVLFILPGPLINQWKSELRYKFNLEIELRNTIKIVALEDLCSSQCADDHWDIIVIDETHRLLSLHAEYLLALKLCRKTENILLLSATPIQDRSEEYLRLLSLLNPEQYENMALEQFVDLVKKQKRIQRDISLQLRRMDRFEDYGSTIIDKLKDISEWLGDKTLKGIVDCIDSDGGDDAKAYAEQALSYICENYRIERKVIRNRRGLIQTRLARRSLEEIPYLPSSADDMYNEIGAIESVLSYLTANSDDTEQFIVSTAQPLLSSLFSSPWALQDQIKRLKIADRTMISCADIWAEQAEQEIANATELMDDPELIKGRMLKVYDYIEQNTGIVDKCTCKIAVFTAHMATLKRFLQLAEQRLSTHGYYAVAFAADMSRDELEDSVYEFQNSDGCRMIICDETGGEGRNFQNAELIIHLDLPWSANVLEQRLGRLDRLGRDPDSDVLSIVPYAENTVEEQLFKIWRDGMKLFEQSLSGLEIITGELNRQIRGALLDDFYNGLANVHGEIKESTDEMRESVLDEQMFDLGATIYNPLNRIIEKMLAFYEGEESNLFAESMLSWSSQAGLEPEAPTKSGLIEFRESRFSPRAALQSLFVPPDWDKYNATTIVRRENRILGTFNRGIAIKREDILFFAPGDSIYDSIISNALGCCKGKCCAISYNGPFNYTGFVFSYNVEPDIGILLDNHLNPKILSQFRMCLPLEPIRIFVPTKASADISEDKIKPYMDEKRIKAYADHLGQRNSGRLSVASPLIRFMNTYPVNDWTAFVIKAENVAKEKASMFFIENSDLATAKKEITRIVNGYKAECLYFGKNMADAIYKQEAYKLAYKALKSSKLELDSACFLRVHRDGQ